MIWTVIRIALFLSLIGALSYGASLLLDTSGGLQITAAGYEITLGPLQSVIVLVALLCAVWLILKLASLLMAVLRFVNGDETALTRFFSRNRERRGFKALTEGVWALASGDGDVAMRKLAKAEKYLAKPELTNVLIAQAAETSGQHDKAHGIYKELVTQDQTRFIGVRGLLKQKLTAGDTQTSLKLAERAHALKPANREVQDILFDLQTEVKDWSGARKTLGGKLKSGALPRDVFRRRDAILALSQARDVLAEDATIDMQEAAIEANRLSPDLAPAAALVADGYIEKKNKRYADRVIKKAWRLAPHPDLAAAYARIDPDEEADTRLKRFEKLAKTNPDHRETKLMMAELHVASEDFPQARRALGDLVETQPDARALTLMAAIERGEGASDVVVRGWLAKALTASRGPQWVCENCSSILPQWAPVCGQCHAFDTLSWKEPARGNTSHLDERLVPLLLEQTGASDALSVEDAEELEVVDATPETDAHAPIEEGLADDPQAEIEQPQKP